MVPAPAGLKVQVTAVLAVKVCVCVGFKVTVCGVTSTANTGFRLTVALADFVESTKLVAVTVTVCCALMTAGAVYSPAAEIVPAPAGVTDHVTRLSPLFNRVGVNCWVSPEESVTVRGAMLTDRGTRLTVTVPVFVGSATLAAVSVTVCCVAITAGAVYEPEAVMVPAPAGDMDQVTAVLAALVTVASNSFVWPP